LELLAERDASASNRSTVARGTGVDRKARQLRRLDSACAKSISDGYAAGGVMSYEIRPAGR
jgi:hypothetical protein